MADILSAESFFKDKFVVSFSEFLSVNARLLFISSKFIFFTGVTVIDFGGATLTNADISGLLKAITSVGSGVSIVNDGSTTTGYKLKSLVAGSNVTIVDNGTDVTINSTAGGGGGITLTDAGSTGLSIIYSNINPTFTLRRILGSGGIDIVDQGTYLEASLTGGAYTLSDVSGGMGNSLVGNGSAPNFTIKQIKAGSGISFNVGSADIEIVNSGAGTTTTLYDVSTGTASIIMNGTGPNIGIRGLSNGNGTSWNTSTYGILAVDCTLSFTMVGSGYDLFTGNPAPNYQVKRLQAGTNVTINDSGSDLTINATAGIDPYIGPGGIFVVGPFSSSPVTVNLTQQKVGNQVTITLATIGATSGGSSSTLQSAVGVLNYPPNANQYFPIITQSDGVYSTGLIVVRSDAFLEWSPSPPSSGPTLNPFGNTGIGNNGWLSHSVTYQIVGT